MGFLGSISKTISGIVDESIRETLASAGEDLSNANSKTLQDVLNHLNAPTYQRDMNVYLQRSGLTDSSILSLPTLQLVNILSGSNSPLRDLHELLEVNDHLIENCKAVIESVKN